MAHQMHIAGCDINAEIVARRPHLLVRIADLVHVLEAHSGVGVEFDVSIDGVTYRGWRCIAGNDVHVRFNNRTFTVRFTPSASQADGAAAGKEVRADMPGVVVAVHCNAGQAIKAGDKLLTIESMKLQMTLVASYDATVERIHVAQAAVFERGATLVSFMQSGSGEA
jgi:acetyl/propionyl-CoA carboxylase alpha subunit